MPLSDHFRPPTTKYGSWTSLHGGNSRRLDYGGVQQLKKQLPPGYISAPYIHSASENEIDLPRYIHADAMSSFSDNDGGVATATWTVAEPSVAV